MAQLSADSFAFGGELMAVEEGVALLAARVAAIGDAETVALADADGRVLARDVVAGVDLPPFDNSAVDGYAVRYDDLVVDADTRLPVAGLVAAGDGWRRRHGRRRGDAHLPPARRCPPGPTRSTCRRTRGSTATPSSYRPG